MASVLVVDDDQGVRALLRRWLDDAGHDTRDADDALAALDVLRTTRIDVVICDIGMPGPSGVWLIERITEAHPETAIIVATGLSEMDPAITLRPGVRHYLTKPFNRAAMLAAVHDAFGAGH
jgi:DNA-binding NtrC family response regulator